MGNRSTSSNLVFCAKKRTSFWVFFFLRIWWGAVLVLPRGRARSVAKQADNILRYNLHDDALTPWCQYLVFCAKKRTSFWVFFFCVYGGGAVLVLPRGRARSVARQANNILRYNLHDDALTPCVNTSSSAPKKRTSIEVLFITYILYAAAISRLTA